ncbi:uncharacterized protein SPSK_10589 [Sporothrix schenckii 1099-18]|uniref:Uncharacterized protein n=1 Tax=Sporothrix schenckii 1099-18 TaxID=1397361 RepID=A0A0F2LZQ9_SPOSC|nr:uncharacterized protein SPSK_10589 [Sporothrix schenckii 1099-18]KJR82932.1 hypothetical protein SPSK_10589 [Sporothrix schenckii 1099-18]
MWTTRTMRTTMNCSWKPRRQGGAALGARWVPGVVQGGRARAKVVASTIAAKVNVEDNVLLGDVRVDVAVGLADVRPRDAPARRIGVGATNVVGQVGAAVLPAPNLDGVASPLDGIDATVGVGKGAGGCCRASRFLDGATSAGVLNGWIVDGVVTVGTQDLAGKLGRIFGQSAFAAS